MYLLLGLFTFSPEGSAVLTIEVTQGVESALPIAIVPFGAPQLPVDIAEVVRADLQSSGRFDSLAPQDMPSQPYEFSDIRFDDWRRLGMENLVIGNVAGTARGEYEIEFRLVDVYKGAQLDGYKITTRPEHLRLAAHQIADAIYEKLTGERGAFATRISYVNVTGTGDNRNYVLQRADADGHNPRTLLESKQPLLSPAWSPDGKQVAYVSFEDKNSAIYVQNLATGKRRRVASGTGINSAPAWAPGGTRLAMTSSKEGDPEIYILDLTNNRSQRITNNSAIDTEPSWSPDGGKIVFTSDRGGSPQIYEVTPNGGNPQRVTIGMGSYNARARYSPDGTKLAMVHREEGSYRIAVMDLNNRTLKVLTDTGLDESPSFAPNGRVIIYASGSELATVSIDGTVRQRLAGQQGEVREPAWGPFR